MSHTFTTLEGGHIILMTEGTDFNFQAEMHAVLEQCLMLLEQGPSHIIFMIDARAFQSPNFDDVMAAGTLARSDEGKAVIRHPKLIKTIVITENKAAQMTLKGINTATFGYVDIRVFPTLDDALAYSESLLAEQPS
jgi:hypothetical protein